jgi:enoyl-CoA hydratase/carnithine racemase
LIKDYATIERRGVVDVVTFLAPRLNALSPDSIKSFSKALYEAERSDSLAVVVTGHPQAFCTGLDLIETAPMDRGVLSHFVDVFDGFFLQMFSMQKPVVIGVRGVAVAGGCVLALCGDARVASSSSVFALAALKLGLPLPAGAMEIARQGLPIQLHGPMLLHAQQVPATEAAIAGFVDDVVEDHRVVDASVQRATSLAAVPLRAFSKMKSDLRYDALTRARARAIESRRIFVEHWFSPESTSLRTAYVTALAAKKAP